MRVRKLIGFPEPLMQRMEAAMTRSGEGITEFVKKCVFGKQRESALLIGQSADGAYLDATAFVGAGVLAHQPAAAPAGWRE